ncbi:formylglycine-generating enzyme family protein [Leptolyngbya sp. 7M]|nr:formylglycine-generating enzyme family protein [Leptolyngbya sp. 7M]
MGSPKDEPERDEDEDPQHQVTLTDFLIGKYPVTQAQWRAVAALPPVNQELDPDPSRFKGEHRPVEQVSWHDAVEFCARLSVKTGRQYDLPTEAEWEYACRAGTTTPFYFGEMITTDLANYDGNYTYNKGPEGIYRNETTPIASFPANAWGLYDMHGNVWEWCADHWHNSYADKPAELKQNGNLPWRSDDDDVSRSLRGGSWINDPRNCRSAFRGHGRPGGRNYSSGFRVVCRAARTPG